MSWCPGRHPLGDGVLTSLSQALALTLKCASESFQGADLKCIRPRMMAALKPPQTSTEKPCGRTQIPPATLMTILLRCEGAPVTPEYSWMGTNQWSQACVVLALCRREGSKEEPQIALRGHWEAWGVVPLRPAAETGGVLSRPGAGSLGPQEGLGLEQPGGPRVGSDANQGERSAHGRTHSEQNLLGGNSKLSGTPVLDHREEGRRRYR